MKTPARWIGRVGLLAASRREHGTSLGGRDATNAATTPLRLVMLSARVISPGSAREAS
jgi:hypothetical protein